MYSENTTRSKKRKPSPGHIHKPKCLSQINHTEMNRHVSGHAASIQRTKKWQVCGQEWSLVLLVLAGEQMLILGKVGGWQEEGCRGLSMDGVSKSMVYNVGSSQPPPQKRTKSQDPMASSDGGSRALLPNQPLPVPAKGDTAS